MLRVFWRITQLPGNFLHRLFFNEEMGVFAFEEPACFFPMQRCSREVAFWSRMSQGLLPHIMPFSSIVLHRFCYITFSCWLRIFKTGSVGYKTRGGYPLRRTSNCIHFCQQCEFQLLGQFLPWKRWCDSCFLPTSVQRQRIFFKSAMFCWWGLSLVSCGAIDPHLVRVCNCGAMATLWSLIFNLFSELGICDAKG